MKAGRVTVAPPLSELPQELMVEIFVRLPPKSFIRCGGVCRAWHVVVSDRAVQLLHHLRQPQYHAITFVRQAGFLDLGVADFCLETLHVQADKIRSIVRFVDTLTLEADDEMGIPFVLHGSLQGVLLISHYEDLFLCNPTTRRWARLHPIHTDSTMVGLYLHPALKEFRIQA